MKCILSWLTVKLSCSPLSCLFRFLAHLPKCSICVPVSAISGVVMEMWNWSVILQETCTLLVWLFVLLLGSIHLPLHSLICPLGSLLKWASWISPWECGHSWPCRLKGSSRDAEHAPYDIFGSAAQGFLRCYCSWSRVLVRSPASKLVCLIIT